MNGESVNGGLSAACRPRALGGCSKSGARPLRGGGCRGSLAPSPRGHPGGAGLCPGVGWCHAAGLRAAVGGPAACRRARGPSRYPGACRWGRGSRPVPGVPGSLWRAGWDSPVCALGSSHRPAAALRGTRAPVVSLARPGGALTAPSRGVCRSFPPGTPVACSFGGASVQAVGSMPWGPYQSAPRERLTLWGPYQFPAEWRGGPVLLSLRAWSSYHPVKSRGTI